MDFVHLHVQSAYSLLQSTVRINELVAEAKKQQMKAIALTDRNVMYGTIPFYKACKASGIKPIIGLYADVLHGEEAYPLLLLAKNRAGYTNLMKISSSIQTKSKEGIPLRWLKGYSEGLIGISPGEEGFIEHQLIKGEHELAGETVRQFQAMFGKDSFYVSVQGDGMVRPGFLDLAEAAGAPIVATNPVRYLDEDDRLAYEVLKAIDAGSRLEDTAGAEGGTSYCFAGKAEMASAFSRLPEAIDNTSRIAEQCHVDIAFHQRLLPKYPTGGAPAAGLLRQICEEGFRMRYPNPAAGHRERLNYELDVIDKMGFNDYFLIVWDFIRFARQNGILTGPGRGSAAGSMVSYVLQITDIDPMEHHLLFERFLNPERVTMPDIDIDFSDIRRDEVISYVAKKYGELHVAQILTFGTFAAKAALRDTGRMFGLNTKELEQLSKMVPSKLGITIRDALNESARLREFYGENQINKRLIDTALKIEGLPRHTSTHAAGVVISDIPLTEIIAVQEGGNGVLLTQFPMETLEELGLLKMDFLGLRNLTLMERVLSSIKRSAGSSLDIKTIPMNDERTLAMLGEGDTIGIFQFESEGMQGVLRQLKPERFGDLVAVNALYRPGPMENIPSYIKRRHGEEPVRFLHPDLEDILGSTYGIIVYQEQIMQIASRFAGFSLGQADLLRRAVSKKKADVLQEQRNHFVNGCLEQGYPEGIANAIYDYIVKFANYGFNLSHAAAYSFIAYQLAYLKAHYPAFFMAALMSSVIGNDSKIAQYARELRKMDIPLLPPSINRSAFPFKTEAKGIRYSLAAIKGVGATAVKEIVKERGTKPFSDLFDFCIRIHSKAVNRKVLESLIHSGAFDEWGEERSTLLATLDVALDHADLVTEDDLFQDTEFNLKPKYIEMEPIPLESRLQKEKEVLGLYLSDHPVSVFRDLFNYYAVVPLFDCKHGKEAKYAVGAYITELKTIRTKKGEVMAFMTISDESDEMEAVVFPSLYKSHMTDLAKGSIALYQGYVEERNGKLQFVVQSIFSIDALLKMQNESAGTFYIKVPKESDGKEALFRLKKILHRYNGISQVKVHFEKNNRTILLPMWDWVNPSGHMVQEITRLFGEKNAIFKHF